MADDRTRDATGEPLSYEHLEPDAKAKARARAEARRLEELPPGALGRYGRSSARAGTTVRLVQFLACVLLVVAVLRTTTGEWLHPGAALLAFLLNLALQQLFVLLNRRS